MRHMTYVIWKTITPQKINLRPAHKSGDAPWVRVASSAQSRLDGPLFHNAPPSETARWKRCVPHLSADYNVDRKGVLFAHASFTHPLTNRRRHRRSMTIAIIIDAAINHKSSGSLQTAISLTPSGSGSGCSTSWAGPWLLIIFSRTAMNEVY